MKTTILTALILIISYSNATSQVTEKLYDPEANANQQIEEALIKATEEGKNVFIQFGGNWCGWCYNFHNFCKNDKEISDLVSKNYVSIKLNYSKENKNEDILARYANPQRLGFPVFIILDSKGTHLHTQDSAKLEKGTSYSKEKVVNFFQKWSPK